MFICKSGMKIPLLACLEILFMGQKTLNSCSFYHENLSFLRINCLQYHKLHVFYLDGHSSAVYTHKEEPDQNRTPVPMTMYIIDG